LFNTEGQEGKESESLSPSEETPHGISTENSVSVLLEKKNQRTSRKVNQMESDVRNNIMKFFTSNEF
jgi:hypothetical protein